MSYDNRLGLEIFVDASQGNAAINSVSKSILGLETATATSSVRMANSMDKMGTDMWKARGAAMLLEQQIGMHLPRAVNTFLAKSQLIGPALQAAFNISVYAAIGASLIALVKGIGEKIGWWGDESEKTKKQTDELTKSIKEQTDALEQHWDRMDKIKRQQGLIGLTGSARVGQERAYSQADVDRLKDEYGALTANLNRLYLRAGEYTIVGGAKRLTPTAIKAGAEASQLWEKVSAAESKYLEAKENLITSTKELHQVQKEEIDKTKQYIDVNKQRAFVSGRDIYGSMLGLPQTPGIPTFGGLGNGLEAANAANMKADEEFVAEWKQRRKDAVDSIIKENENLAISIARSKDDYFGMLQMELSQLDELKLKYSDNADAIIAIEERKKLRIQQYNQEVADQAKQQYDKSVSAIEGFIDRVFLHAKSASDIWKQLLSQIAGQAVKVAAQYLARLFGGPAQTTGTGATGGTGSGLINSIMSIFGNWGAKASVSGAPASTVGAFTAEAMKGGGNANALGSGWGDDRSWFSKSYGGGGISQAAGIAGDLLLYLSQRKGIKGTLGGDVAELGGGAAKGFSMSGGNPIGALVGFAAMSTKQGWQHGGFRGNVQMGFSPELNTLRKIYSLFHTPNSEWIHGLVKSKYGIDIKDKTFLAQIEQMAKDNFGGNFTKAVQSAEVQELVRLYAYSTGQSTGGMRAEMQAASIMQQAGQLYQQGSYVQGSLAPSSGGSIPSLGGSAKSGMGPMVINVNVPGAKDFFKNETVSVVVGNPRSVQTASVRATKSNYNRRELTALQLSPGTLIA